MKEKAFAIGETFKRHHINESIADTLLGFEEPSEYTPAVDPNYQYAPSVATDLFNWWEHGADTPLLLWGPTGSGKTSAVKTLAGCLNVPVYERNVHEGLYFEELAGKTDLMVGSTVYQYGVIPKAMGVEGQPGILLLNEVDMARNGVAPGMYEVITGAPFIVPNGGGELIRPHKYFRVVFTANTALIGDLNGLHPGAKRQSLAFRSRMWKVKVDYPAKAVEMDILARAVPKLDASVREAMVDSANEIRFAFIGHPDFDHNKTKVGLEVTLSTRELILWAKLTWVYRSAVQSGLSPHYVALERALISGLPAEQRTAILAVVGGVFGDNPLGAVSNG